VRRVSKSKESRDSTDVCSIAVVEVSRMEAACRLSDGQEMSLGLSRVVHRDVVAKASLVMRIVVAQGPTSKISSQSDRVV